MGFGYSGDLEYLMRSLHGYVDDTEYENIEEVIGDSTQIITVQSISELSDINTNNIVRVMKYHLDLDYIPKYYIFKSDIDKSYHNGGNIIDPLKIFPESWDDNSDWFSNKNSGIGVWISYEPEQLDAKWFGAKGDGISDDYLPLQTAIYSLTGWNGNLYKTDYINPKTLYIPEGTYRITDSLRITQMNNIKGEGYSAGNSKGTEILCDFIDFAPPTDNYSNTYEEHPLITLDKKPMMYNVKMFNYCRLENIRFNGNNKDVYGLHLNDCYYNKIDTISMINCLNSGFTFIYGQFNEIRNISYINNAGPIRLINCATLDFDNLDIESSQSPETSLEIVHSSQWKGGINIRNIHIEELGALINPGDVFKIGQKGVKIEGLFALFSTDVESGSTERYIHYLDPQDYYFDGNTITTSPVYSCELESVGNGHMKVKLDPDVRNCKILGYAIEQEEGSNVEHQISYTEFLSGLRVKNSQGYKILWFEDDTIHLFDNSNRNIRAESADTHFENTSGRQIISSGVSTGTSEIQLRSSITSILDKDGNHGTWEQGVLRLSGHYLWVDSTGKMRLKNTYPTSDTDGNLVGI